jgi:hypothetical protein
MTWEGNEKCVQQDNVCINVTLRRVRVTTVATKKQYILRIHIACVCNFIYRACKAHHLIILTNVACLALPYFSTLSHKRHGFRKISSGHKMCVLIFTTHFVWNISHSTNNSARYYHKCKHVFVWCNRYSFQILTKREFFRQISEK